MASSTIGTGYIQIIPTTKGIKENINSEMSSAGSEGGKSFSSGFSSVISGLGKVAATSLAAGSAAVGALVKQSVSAYSDFEQLVGGVETLFGAGGAQSIYEYADAVGKSVSEIKDEYSSLKNAELDVLANANNAYATAGMSANEYMETVTSFSAALISSLDGDTQKAASAADQAIIDMSDNANKMGTDIESIQNAYQSFARGQYTLLDNLKLGYGGTKSEMERLLEDASKLSGVKYDISNLADVYNAIHVVQENLGIAGTTAKEASTTIQGSAGQMSAAWQNLLAGMGNENANMTDLVNSFVTSVSTFVGNLTPVIETALSGVVSLISELAPIIATEVPALLTSILPQLMATGLQIIEALAQGIVSALPTLMPTIVQLIMDIANFIIENLPLLIESGMQIIMQLATALTEAIPQLVPTIVEVVTSIAMYLVENIDVLIDAAIQLITALAEGLMTALPILITKIPTIIAKLLTSLLAAIPKLAEAGKKIITVIVNGLMSIKDQLFTKAVSLITTLKDKFIEKVKGFIDIGKNIVEGIKNGIKNAWNNLLDWLSNLCGDLLHIVMKALGIGSPSKEFADNVGQWIPAGIAVGIQNGMDVLNSEIEDMTNATIEGAVGVESTIASAKFRPTATSTSDDVSTLVSLISTYLPTIAQGKNVNVSLEGDAGRLFRVMQTQQRRNAELVGI